MAPPSNAEHQQDPIPDLDPFDTLLTLEDQYHTEGYSLGVGDGIRAGRIDGRLFGLEKGFDKFAAIGKLSGRACVWRARIPPSPNRQMRTTDEPVHTKYLAGSDALGPRVAKLLPLSGTERLRKHIARLLELTDPETLETKNTEDAVNECEERLAGARAKFALLSKMVGEDDVVPPSSQPGTRGTEVEIGRSGKPKGKEDVEDFAGLPFARKVDPPVVIT